MKRIFALLLALVMLASLCACGNNENKTSVTVDEKISEMLEFSKEMHRRTNGNVNVAFGSVLSIWHEYRNRGLNNPEDARLPSIDELSNADKHTDIDNLIINDNISF